MHTDHEIFEELWQEFARVDTLRLVFKGLYADDTVEGLNRHASWLFSEIQRALGDTLLMQIARMADPDSNALTFRKLFNRLCVPAGPQRAKVEQQLRDLDDACEPIRTHRDKRIAHNEVKVALKSRELPTLLNQDITRALKAMQPLIDSFNELLGATKSSSIEVRSAVVEQAERVARHFNELASLPR